MVESIKNAPNLIISKDIQISLFGEDNRTDTFCYESKRHINNPHVVKFSGGRTSGMLLFVMLEAGLLKAERGDVVVFNNTAAEHPETYKFVKKCKQVVEEKYGIPFFWVEYQTYEDARKGEYIRIPSFKLVNTEPYSEDNPHGYHWRGEVFEEMLSQKGYVPTLFQRICTKSMKIEASSKFLEEWFANKEATERLGHFGTSTRMTDDELYERHLRHNGSVPRKVFLRKKEFLKNRPTERPSQAWADYSSVVVPFKNAELEGADRGRYVKETQYLSFIGIRYDEMHRVGKIQRRNFGGVHAEGRDGEYVYMPLVKMNITQDMVQEFWANQDWNLGLR